MIEAKLGRHLGRLYDLGELSILMDGITLPWQREQPLAITTVNQCHDGDLVPARLPFAPYAGETRLP